MKKLLTLFSLASIFLFFGVAILIPKSSAQEAISFRLDPEQDNIDDSLKTVTVTFPELDGGGKYQVCLENHLCVKNPILRSLLDQNPGKFITAVQQGVEKEDFYDAFETLNGNSIRVCGNGRHALKVDCEGDVWFHSGNFYYVTLFEEQAEEMFLVGIAGFYVNHRQPKVVVIPQEGKAPENFKVRITLDKLVKDGKNKSNNFEVVFEGRGIKEDVCVEDFEAGVAKEIDFPTSEWFNDDDNWVNNTKPAGVISGKYIIKINERINEGGIRREDCQGGFTYQHIICTVSKDNTECETPEENPELYDPNQSDANKLFKLLDILAGGSKGATLPCTKSYSVKNPLDCNEIDTAIGKIQLTPVGFITRLFSIILSVGAVGALLLIIYSGYRLLLSRGNKEVIQGARETITAAIVGLVFIIFSLVILSIITGDILKIPGFG